MKAITLHQPYATLVANGTKRYETRSWAPPQSLLGERIAIHAAKVCGPTVRANCLALTPGATDVSLDEFSGRAGRCIVTWKSRQKPYHAPELLDACYPLGEVVATAVVNAAGQVAGMCPRGFVHVRWANGCSGRIEEDRYGCYSVGRWVWELTDVKPVNPTVPARGRQGFWNWEPANQPRTDT